MALANGGNATGNKKTWCQIGVVVVALIVLTMLIAGCKEKTETPSETNTATPGAGAPGTTGAGPTMGSGPVGGMAMGVAPMAGGAGQAVTTIASTTASTGAASAVSSNAPRYTGIGPQPIRSNPFAPLPYPKGRGPGMVRSPALQPILPAVLQSTGGIRIQQTRDLSQARRAVGLVWGRDAYGMLQIGNDTYIVRTGDEVAGYTVTGITRDSIILYSPDLKKQIQVPLQGPRSKMPESYGTPPPTELSSATTMPRQGITTPAVRGQNENQDDIAPGVPDTPFE